jgi:hypothetical protein
MTAIVIARLALTPARADVKVQIDTSSAAWRSAFALVERNGPRNTRIEISN